jgi:hypothetical protein
MFTTGYSGAAKLTDVPSALFCRKIKPPLVSRLFAFAARNRVAVLKLSRKPRTKVHFALRSVRFVLFAVWRLAPTKKFTAHLLEVFKRSVLNMSFLFASAKSLKGAMRKARRRDKYRVLQKLVLASNLAHDPLVLVHASISSSSRNSRTRGTRRRTSSRIGAVISESSEAGS